jgi:GNAT superfamily N-acetyltransferase
MTLVTQLPGDITISIDTEADLHGPVAETVLAGLIAYNTAKLPPSTGRFAVLARDLASDGLRAGLSVGLTGPVAVSAWGVWSDGTSQGDALLWPLLAVAEAESRRRGADRFVLYIRPGTAMPPDDRGWQILAHAEAHECGLPYRLLIKTLTDELPPALLPGFGLDLRDPPSKPLGADLWRRGDAHRLRRLPVRSVVLSAVARQNGLVVAGALCRIAGSDLMLDMMWVDDRLRGQNVGRATLSAALDAGRLRGCTRAATETLDCQALGFYQSLGYQPHAYSPTPVAGLGMHFLQRAL